jgi:hypothetical protein
MEEQKRVSITVETTVPVSPELAWAYWTEPKHITQWNQASEDWHTPRAENDLRVGGKFSSRMESKDGKFGFDFWGIYDAVEPHSLLHGALGVVLGHRLRHDVELGAAGDVEPALPQVDVAREGHVEREPLAGGQRGLRSFEVSSERHGGPAG